jgi:hypothetical protein
MILGAYFAAAAEHQQLAAHRHSHGLSVPGVRIEWLKPGRTHDRGR